MPGCSPRALCCVVLLALAPSTARGYDFEISARTEGYGYQLRRYDSAGVSFLNRRRVTQYLGLRVFNLLDPGEQAFAPARRRPPALLTFEALMRFEADFGAYARPEQAIDEIENNQIDIMLGTLEGRNLWGVVDFTLGRQYDGELFDLFAFDGLRLRVNLPWHVFLESHFGVQTARAHPFSAAVFEPDGTSGDPSDEAWAPTFGVAGGVEDLGGFGFRAAYRGTATHADGEQLDDPIWGIDEEALFLATSYQVPVLRTRAAVGVRYSVLLGQVDDVQVALGQKIGWRHDLELEYLRSRPHFDGDSIFNLFATEPFHEGSARYALRVLEPLELGARVGYRRFFEDEDDAQPDGVSAGLSAHWRGARLRGELELFFLGGLGARTLGADLGGRYAPWTWLELEGRASLIDLDDETYPSRLLNLGLQLGARLRFWRGVVVHFVLEDNVSRIYDSALRLFAVLDLELSP